MFQAVVGVLNFWKVLDDPQVGGRNILTIVTPLAGHGPYILGLYPLGARTWLGRGELGDIASFHLALERC